jgi:hypothetical protein
VASESKRRGDRGRRRGRPTNRYVDPIVAHVREAPLSISVHERGSLATARQVRSAVAGKDFNEYPEIIRDRSSITLVARRGKDKPRPATL